MPKADRRTGHAAGVRPLDSDAVAELVAGVPSALLLTVGANSIRLAQADHADPAAAVANRNRVLTAFHCLARFLDEAGPDLADLDVAAGFSREAADAVRRRIEANAAVDSPSQPFELSKSSRSVGGGSTA